MKNWSALLFIFLFLLGTGFSGKTFAEEQSIDLVKARAALNSAKASLEEARKKRDMALAARWKDRETANQERELFNEKYKENKEKVEALMTERARLQEDVRVGREDLSQIKAASEALRAEFLSLAAGPEKLSSLQQLGEQGVPFDMPARLEKFNKLKKEMDLYRDDPLRIAKGIFALASSELAFSREIRLEKGELVFDSKVTPGFRFRLGGLYAAQASSEGEVALMLPISGEKKRSFAWQENLSEEVNAQVKKALLGDSNSVLFPADVLLSTALSSELASRSELSLQEKAKQFFRDGGILMYPILVIFLFGLFISLERLLVIFWKGRTGASKKVLRALNANELERAKTLEPKLRGATGKVLRALLAKDYPDRESAEKAVEEVFAKETPALERGLSSLSVCASVAPLLGLLGTVMGMIQLFEVITMHGTSDPKLLAGGISVALVTTESGLIVAIPLLLLHTFLQNRADRVLSKMERAGLSALNALWIKR